MINSASRAIKIFLIISFLILVLFVSLIYIKHNKLVLKISFESSNNLEYEKQKSEEKLVEYPRN